MVAFVWHFSEGSCWDRKMVGLPFDVYSSSVSFIFMLQGNVRSLGSMEFLILNYFIAVNPYKSVILINGLSSTTSKKLLPGLAKRENHGTI